MKRKRSWGGATGVGFQKMITQKMMTPWQCNLVCDGMGCIAWKVCKERGTHEAGLMKTCTVHGGVEENLMLDSERIKVLACA
jgi:hypothetical protein